MKIPQVIIEKIKKIGSFNQGYASTEAFAAAALDLQWHTLSNNLGKQDVNKFEATTLQKVGLALMQVPPRYRSSYFLHIWTYGYAAGYYAYAWTDMLNEDAFSWFQKHGGLTRENGQRFRDIILSRSNTENYGKMYKTFTGRNPDVKPMLIKRGLIK